MSLVTLPRPMAYPDIPTTGVVGLTNRTINDDTDELAILFQLPQSGTLTAIAISVGALTASENSVPFRLETVGTDGFPTGTLYQTNATGTANITTSNSIVSVSINGGSGVAATVNNLVAWRWKRNTTGTLNTAFFTDDAASSVPGYPTVHDYNITSAGAWGRPNCGHPLISVQIDGAWSQPTGCLSGLAVFSDNTITNPAQGGLLIQPVVGMRAIGAVLPINLVTNAVFTFDLYSDPLGTPVSVATTIPIYSAYGIPAQTRVMEVPFVAPATLVANAPYALVLTPTAAANPVMRGWTLDTTYQAAYPNGPDMVYVSRANSASGAFSATATKTLNGAVLIDAIDTGGGGQFVLAAN